MKWLPVDCRPGDMIRISIGSIYHYGIFCSEDEIIEFGEAPEGSIFRDFDSIKVISVDIDRFSSGRIVEVAQLDRKERKARFSAKKTVDLARSMLGQGGYDLLHNNCEHFANYCIFGEKRCSKEDEARLRWKKRSYFDLYIAPVPGEIEITRLYPNRRNEEISGTTNEKLKNQMYYVWRLLGFAVKQALDLDMTEICFEKSPGGKWLCDKCCFSLSHTDGFVAAAISDKPVGIDIERLSSRKEKTTPEMLSKMAERTNIALDPGDPYRAFLEGWTKKEAAFKCENSGSFDPLKAPLMPVETFKAFDCIVSYCGESAPLSIFWMWDGGKSRSMVTPEP